MLIGEKIKQLRIAAGLTQADLGAHLNVGKATIQKYECNQIQNLKTTHIRKLCALFDKTPNYFIFDEIPRRNVIAADTRTLRRENPSDRRKLRVYGRQI